MGITDVFWLFLIIGTPTSVSKEMLRILRALEKKRGSLVIALVHREETMSFLGFPLVRYIDVQRRSCEPSSFAPPSVLST
jgi:hypothetical protein